jgi:antitoxin YefM
MSEILATTDATGHLDIGQDVGHDNPMNAISYTYARENLKSVIDKVIADHNPVAIIRQRGEGAVLVSAEDWSSMQETLYLLSSPANAKHLMDGIARFDAGLGEEHELIQP